MVNIMPSQLLDHKSDFYQEVIEKDQAFISWMNTLHPNWQTWEYKQKRMFAKQFKFAENYSVKPKQMMKMFKKEKP